VQIAFGLQALFHTEVAESRLRLARRLLLCFHVLEDIISSRKSRVQTK
jgi:hypothetical protein